jgi:hypothetical protein
VGGLRGGAALVLGLALVLCGCAGVPPATQSPTSSAASLDPAIAYAISQRKQFGLRSDLAWVLAVAADPRARINMLDFLMLPEEEAEFSQRQSDFDAVVAAVQAYAAGKEAVFGGLYLDQVSHTVVALWTTDPLLHRIAILMKLGTSGPLATRQVKYSEKQLRDLQDRISSDIDWLRGIDAQAMGVGVDIIANATSLTISSANAAAPGIIRTHYGVPADMLKIDSDGTGIMLQPRGTIEGTVRTSDGKAPGENGLDLRWKADTADRRDCGSGVGLGVPADGLFTLPCAPGGWTIWLAAALADGWTDVGGAHVVLPPGGTVKLLITLKPGAKLGP